MRRVLRPTGSIYLHCDPTASHYLKTLMDAVFGRENFRNDIAWCYRKWSVAASQFTRNHDTVLFYSRDKNAARPFNVQYISPSAGTIKRWKGRKQQAVFEHGVRKATSIDDKGAGVPCPDWWRISIINPNARERIGYPTQKPLKLLDRIIRASSNPGDMVLDPFCGCATALVAAETLGRRWAGIGPVPAGREACRATSAGPPRTVRRDHPTRGRADAFRSRQATELPDAPAHALRAAGGHLQRVPCALSVPQPDSGSHRSEVEGRERSSGQPPVALRGLRLEEGRAHDGGADSGPPGRWHQERRHLPEHATMTRTREAD